MIYARSSAEALAGRRIIKSPGTGIEHWGAEFFGPRSSTSVAPGPQATMSDLNPNEAVLPIHTSIKGRSNANVSPC